MAGLNLLYKLLLKDVVKGSGQASGIMSIGGDIRKLADKKFQSYVMTAKAKGVDLDKLSEQEIKYMLQLNKPKPIKAISADSPEGKLFTQGMIDMLDKASGKNVIKTDFGGGITDIVTETITKIKSKKPIEAMAEANSVLARKGKYKNLTEEQSQKIIKDTEDHIFERDIKPDPEDFAHGGRTGSGLNYLLGEDDQNTRVPFGAGGFNAARRAFLKLTGGAAAGVGAAKTGLFGLLKGGGKKQIVEEAIKQSAGSGTPPAYFFNLVKKIKNLGDDVTETGALAERQNVKTYKDYTLTEDTVTGRQEIQRYKTSEEATHYGQPLTEETYMSYTPGEIISQGTKKGKPKVVKTQPEYDEGTAYIRNDGPSTGEIVDESSVISKEVVQEGTVFEDTIAEFTKKASGGRVPMWLGGGLGAGKSFIRELVKKLAKDKGMTGSQIMKVLNPKAYQKFLDDPANVHKWEPKTGLMASEKAKQLMKSTKGARAEQLEHYLGMAKSSKEGDENIKKLIDAAMETGMSRESAERMAKGLREGIDIEDLIPRNVTDETILDMEQMLKNLKTEGRQLNASGGRASLSAGGLAGMLGE